MQAAKAWRVFALIFLISRNLYFTFFIFLKKSVCDFISDLDPFMLAIVAYLRRLAHMAPVQGQNYGIRFTVKLTVFGGYLLNNWMLPVGVL